MTSKKFRETINYTELNLDDLSTYRTSGPNGLHSGVIRSFKVVHSVWANDLSAFHQKAALDKSDVISQNKLLIRY